MSKERVRVLRILEYVGDREWVEETLRNGGVPANGTSEKNTGKHNIIKSAVIDQFPEILIDSEQDEKHKRIIEVDCFEDATHWMAQEDSNTEFYKGVITGRYYPIEYDEKEEEYHIIDEEEMQSLIYLTTRGKLIAIK